jgi:RNA polymerase primary sigma factor
MNTESSNDEESIDELEEEQTTETEKVILHIAKLYERHPRVLKAIEQCKNGKPPRRSAMVDPLGRYMQEAGQFSLLTKEDEIDLFNTLYCGVQLFFDISDQIDETPLTPEHEAILIEAAIAYQKIFVSNTRLVMNLARRLNGYEAMPLMDLITEGNIGLSKAITKFDVARGFKFSTFATWWVRQQITRAIGDQSRMVRLPIHRHEAYLKLRRDMKQLSEIWEREVTPQDMAEITGESVKKIEKLLKDGSQYYVSIDAEYDNGKPSTVGDTGTSLGEILPELAEMDVDVYAARLAIQDEARELLDAGSLDIRELFILSLRFGLDLPELHGRIIEGKVYEDYAAYDADHTLEEISQIVGVTRERVRQIEGKALAKIRAKVDPDVLSAGIF